MHDEAIFCLFPALSKWWIRNSSKWITTGMKFKFTTLTSRKIRLLVGAQLLFISLSCTEKTWKWKVKSGQVDKWTSEKWKVDKWTSGQVDKWTRNSAKWKVDKWRGGEVEEKWRSGEVKSEKWKVRKWTNWYFDIANMSTNACNFVE